MAKGRKGGKPKATGKEKGPKEATVLIPLTYNDGTAVSQDILLGIFEELYVAFHGWTNEGTVKGAYRMQAGEQRVEDLLKVSVVLDEMQIPELERMVSEWGARLGQETMLLKIADSTIKFVPSEGGGIAMKTSNRILDQAKELAGAVESWADLSNALFDPVDGLITRAYPTRAERQAFLKTDEYKKIRDLLAQAIDTHGLVEGATPKKSGRFVVRLPQSLHAALEREAAREGVSLNQLVVAKLSAQLNTLTG
jgi:predicted HicB family RNase H-like nuclease